MEYIKINNTEYPAEISGLNEDYAWDRRESKTIHILEGMTIAEALELFVDGASWSIISEWQEQIPEEVDGNALPNDEILCGYVTRRNEFDNSDFNLAGDITDHRDGTISIKMGKMTDLEDILSLFLGGE